MKRIVYSVLFLLLVCAASNAQFVKADLRADGLTCSLCSSATEKQLRKLDFIDSIGIDLDHATFILYFTKDKTIDFDKIKKAVENAGFSVGMLKAIYNFKNRSIDTNSCFNFQNTVFCFVDVTPQTLDGEVAVQIIDEGFLPKKEFKKYAAKLAAHTTNQTMRVYHVTL